LHTITNRPWSVETCISHYAKHGLGGITIWRQNLEGRDPVLVGRQAQEAGLKVVSLCRGGFFPAAHVRERQLAIEDNLRTIDQAAALGTDLIVLVCGAIPGQDLNTSRQQITEGIAAVLPHAQACGVRLGIEPLHPMYADQRSAVNTIAQSLEIIEELDYPSHLGITTDVYHVWWDPSLEASIQKAGELGKLFSYHWCDWKVPTVDMLNDRGIPGEGCIPLTNIRAMMTRSGFQGFDEVEIFSNEYWAMDQEVFLQKILDKMAVYLEEKSL
jgi:sugar phosphate isomerase/epimerase